MWMTTKRTNIWGKERSTTNEVKFRSRAYRSSTRWKLVPRWHIIRRECMEVLMVVPFIVSALTLMSQGSTMAKCSKQTGAVGVAPKDHVEEGASRLPTVTRSRSYEKQSTTASTETPVKNAPRGNELKSPALLPLMNWRAASNLASKFSHLGPVATSSNSVTRIMISVWGSNVFQGKPLRSRIMVLTARLSAVSLTMVLALKKKGIVFSRRYLYSNWTVAASRNGWNQNSVSTPTPEGSSWSSNGGPKESGLITFGPNVSLVCIMYKISSLTPTSSPILYMSTQDSPVSHAQSFRQRNRR
mmetsp:Transcript_110894/g.313694  ORF Transcript_110894/g.313694 Transcript_110894/m.313694 type:complete len:300 (+) Transcript_110894:179-1078(+)